LFNQYGYSDSNSSNNTSSFLSAPVALCKLMSTVVWMDTLLALVTRQQHPWENHHDQPHRPAATAASPSDFLPACASSPWEQKPHAVCPEWDFPFPFPPWTAPFPPWRTAPKTTAYATSCVTTHPPGNVTMLK
jgi:hypothetical protein